MSNSKPKAKSLILLSGLSVIFLLLAVFIIGSPSKDEKKPADNTLENLTESPVTMNTEERQSNDIADIKEPQPEPSTSPASSPVVIPEIKEQPTVTDSPVLQPETKKEDVKVPITPPKETPKPTEPPKPKPKTTTQDKSTPPVYDEKETQPAKKESEPKAGDKNSKGQVWFPGFGWVENSGDNHGSVSESDGDWNKQVGEMN
ncbi:DUF6550 family protein [Paenibacillus sp. MSJ-34]|uniref:DUF6550 family protein n=1 Tax=Paenibacillus sp. MSJ-34 TaxID=2841529 RepID=UPI001C107417|nr:DUF6550 family protein [Paenibacillus sp. MSJ-34]MBU5445250.1 hypothetical protein [Paenibacillus sp. MSJ-34]